MGGDIYLHWNIVRQLWCDRALANNRVVLIASKVQPEILGYGMLMIFEICLNSFVRGWLGGKVTLTHFFHVPDNAKIDAFVFPQSTQPVFLCQLYET